MKYALVIPDGAADTPNPALDNRTPLEVANIPNMDRLAREGKFGLAKTVPDGMLPGSDVANLSVLGYAPEKYYTGRSPLEAANLGIELKDNEAVFRANTVIIEDGAMKDFAGGHIGNEQSIPLIEYLNDNLKIDGVKLYPGTSYRHACVFSNMPKDKIPSHTPPHDITDKSIEPHGPQGELAARIIEVEQRTRELLLDWEVNKQRIEKGQMVITQLWLWGGGVMPKLDSFQKLYGVGTGLISAVDLLKGIAGLAGMEVIEVEGATGYYDTNYKGKGEAALESLKRNDLVIVHVEAPDEAGHNGDVQEKVRALERIDEHILAPLLAEADKTNDLRILCLPDHPTPLEIKTHTSEPVPYALWGPGIEADGGDAFDEKSADGRACVIGSDLMGMLTS